MFFATYLASIITHYEPIYKSLGVLVFLLVEVAFVGCVAIGFLQSGSGCRDLEPFRWVGAAGKSRPYLSGGYRGRSATANIREVG